MDERSVTPVTPRPTLCIVAGGHLCDQVALSLGIGEKAARESFLGEPVQEVLAMVSWALSHEGEDGFDPEGILVAWARRRGRGAWRTEDLRGEGCGRCHRSGWSPSPFTTAEGWDEDRQGVECPACRGTGVASKPLKTAFNGREGR